MQIAVIDMTIVAAYLLAIISIGFYLKKRASKDMSAYYQGGRKLPWYMLGLSNASGMFDISGTMWLVTLMFVYGMKSIWIPWLWPVFNQVFLMVYLSIWLRRSNVLTGAEWMRTRFGDSHGGKLSHFVVVLFAIISVLGFLAYGFVGVGKFVEIFVPYEIVSPYLPFELSPEFVPHFYGISFTAIATLYVMLGGMMSIVWADVLQFTIMTFAALAIGFIAMAQVSPDALSAATPEGWNNPFFGWSLSLDWSGIIDEVNDKILSDGYSLFSIFVMMMLFKGVLVSAAGPAPNYDMQKILATKSPKEGALMSGFVSIVLMPIRYFMIAGFTVLAIVYYDRLDLVSGGSLDFENILPSAILEFAPVGILGILLAGLIAAFMSTFAATVNAAPAYLVNDIYHRYINPNASNKTLIRASYLISVAVVVISTFIGLYVQSINSVLQWLVSGLWGGYVVSNVLKWYWWRLNGYGYFFGMLAGIVGALVFPPIFSAVFPEISSDIAPLSVFPILLIVSGLVCILVSIYTPHDDIEVLKSFYKTVRPWGFWGPIKAQVMAEDPDFVPNKNFKNDMFNVATGVVTQTCLVALPVFIVIKEWGSMTTTLVILVVSATLLKRNWYNKLDENAA
ncbi:sodium:solute symporter family protein [Agaribacter marinus]|uniref:Sodium:solute symporter n=1 Tax=Agaribacter marinus TaxID=1431249 RepID=A0AA37SXT6_9ALTE|nr:sodium:solute symporter family protein [Agaribacter marinus]GLR71802.1 sodium:solute symporter [Agaribacter marinus]